VPAAVSYVVHFETASLPRRPDTPVRLGAITH